ncbi:hypothetical protein F6B41_09715 [Microbacterium lushaniae]|nr:hypothetical protein F6B41_21470 [Microbacterium lushaniae]KAA9155723.1 hypothetical protein F6B41_09715 [Microbacterium lushaniae]
MSREDDPGTGEALVMYSFIRPASLPFVETAEHARDTGAVAIFPPGMNATLAERAATTVRADYARVSRWLLGLLGTAGAAFAALGVLAAVAALAPGRVEPVIVLELLFGGISIAAIAGVPSVLLLWKLHTSGRRLARAAGFWAALPYLAGARQPVTREFIPVQPPHRTADLLLRFITVSLGLLAAAFSVSTIFYATLVAPNPALWVAAVLWSALFVGVTLGQCGGIVRVERGYGYRDPRIYDRRMRRARERPRAVSKTSPRRVSLEE